MSDGMTGPLGTTTKKQEGRRKEGELQLYYAYMYKKKETFV